MEVQRYRQTTSESCLAVALLQLIALQRPLRITRKLEQQCCFSALRHTREDFVVGHLRFLTKRFGVRWKRLVQFPRFAQQLKRFGQSGVELHVAPINARTIDRLLAHGPLAILLDDFALFCVYHYPHWVLVLARRGKRFHIFEPWEGKTRWIPARVLENGIALLRKHLRMSPQLIQLQ